MIDNFIPLIILSTQLTPMLLMEEEEARAAVFRITSLAPIRPDENGGLSRK